MQLPDNLEAFVESLTPEQLVELAYDWHLKARPEQLLPDDPDWYIFHANGGRGSGKSESGSQAVRQAVEEGAKTIALVGPTLRDVRQYMIQGDSGLINVFPPTRRPVFKATRREVHFDTGAIAYCYTSEEPENIRGFNGEFAWCDELGSWIKAQTTWDNLQFAMRKGNPRIVVTSTPRVTPLMKWLWHEAHLVNGKRLYEPDGSPKPDRGVIRRTFSTMDNAKNLDPRFVERLTVTYGGTRLGRQELYAELLEDIVGALFQQDDINRYRITGQETDQELRMHWRDEMDRLLVAVDPAVTFGDASDQHGIIVVGLKNIKRGAVTLKHGYVLDDRTLTGKVEDAARVAIQAYRDWAADRIIVETNNGGDWIETVIKNVNRDVNVKQVRASRGKLTRAEPIAALYAEGRIHHVGTFEKLEQEITEYVPSDNRASPNRMDALVWGMTDVFDIGQKQAKVWLV